MSEQRKPKAERGRFGGGNIGAPAEKAKDAKQTLKNLLAYMREYKIGLFLVVCFSIGGTIFGIVGPKILGMATTEIFQGIMGKITGGAGINFEKITQIIILLLGLYVLSTLLSFVQGYLMTGITQKVTYRMRREISEKINHLPMRYFDGVSHGEVLSRVTNDVDTLSQSLNQSAAQLITAITTIIGVLIMMFSINIMMTLVAFTLLPIAMLLLSVVMKRSQKYFVSQQESLGKLNGQVEEIYGGHNIVKVFNREEDSIREFDEINDALYGSAWKSQFFSGMMMPIMQFVGNLGYVGITILGGYLAIKNTIQVGDILSFIQYVRGFTQPLQQVAQAANMLQSMTAASERVFAFLAEEEEQDEEQEDVKAWDMQKISGHVTFENVRFGYTPENVVIKDFSIDVHSGQKVAIVGPTGAGKSTLVKLLMRFYDVNAGRILVDGYDAKSLKRTELRQAFGMVLQDTWLFNGTIMENIRYGRQDATDEEVQMAAKAAYVHRFVQTLPNGYDMCLNEEVNNVSQGQKQLLTIARAILADPKILILDEATSSVDTRTEVQIQKAMNNLMEGRTSFVIAHRLSTIRDADVILVMKDGDIVEQGNHEMLMQKAGFYAELYNAQFEKKV